MHGVVDLQRVALDRLENASVLFDSERFAGVSYLAGYAVETALKARICLTLGWLGFPETRREFEGYQSLKTHDLEVLLRFTGREEEIRTTRRAEWSLMLTWDPTKRYSAAAESEENARALLAASTTLVADL